MLAEWRILYSHITAALISILAWIHLQPLHFGIGGTDRLGDIQNKAEGIIARIEKTKGKHHGGTRLRQNEENGKGTRSTEL